MTQSNDVETPKKKRTRITPGTIVLIVGFLAIVIVIGIQLFNRNQTQPKEGPAPDFELHTYDGETFRLSEQKGNVVLINFWGSWCAPCRTEAPELQELWEQFQDQNVVFIGVDKLDTEESALSFIDEFGLTYPNGLDIGEKIAKSYNTELTPESFIIDQQGNVAEFIYGPINLDSVQAKIEELLADNEA